MDYPEIPFLSLTYASSPPVAHLKLLFANRLSSGKCIIIIIIAYSLGLLTSSSSVLDSMQ